MIKSKKQMFIIIGVFTLVMMLGTITYAFFNYTRTGSSNNIRVGRISFVSKNEETITLSNIFPIDPSNQTDMNDNTKVGTYSIEIKGDTDYVDGIEYLISAVDANIYSNQGQIVPISLDVTVTDLGTASPNYFTARESKNATIYKKLVGNTLVGDQMLLVGYIPQNNPIGTADGVDGSITIKAYLDTNKIKISDTYDGTESDNMGTTNEWAEGKTVITTSEWNALQSSGVSFKVKVEANEGIWVYGSLEEIMRNESLGVDTEQGVDFGKFSTTDGLNNEGTKGVYMRAGTQNDSYPIVYYRGAVEDNNVIFRNYCWKIVRTTDTGGVKLIYNGEPSDITRLVNKYGIDYYSGPILTDSNFTFDSDSKEWSSNVLNGKSFSISVPGDYILNVNYQLIGTLTINRNNEEIFSYSGLTPGEKRIVLNDVLTTDIFTISFAKMGPGTDLIKISLAERMESIGVECNNMRENSHISVEENGVSNTVFRYNNSNSSPAYSGYMYGEVYEYSSSDWISDAKFGNNFTWNGLNYKLTDATVTAPDSYHHYSCNSTNAEATCTELRYVFKTNGNTKYYIILHDGKSVEDAMTEMQTNTTDSRAKQVIDSWYATNMLGVTNKLEDTIWCNDRSVGVGNNNGWIANGGDLSVFLFYGASQRSKTADDTSTVMDQPSLECVNKNDRFTVNNMKGNQALTYPVGLLTADEVVLSGGLPVGAANSQDSYLYNESHYATMTPYGFTNYFYVQIYGISWSTFSHGNTYADIGFRPVISLKPGTPVVRGSGIVTDPYVIE